MGHEALNSPTFPQNQGRYLGRFRGRGVIVKDVDLFPCSEAKGLVLWVNKNRKHREKREGAESGNQVCLNNMKGSGLDGGWHLKDLPQPR